MRFRFPQAAALACLMLLALSAALTPGQAQGFVTLGRFAVVPLTSDLPGVGRVTDGRLVNPWGMAMGTTGLIWIANNGTGIVASYNKHGLPQSQAFTVPAPPGQMGVGAPTGLVRPTKTKGFRVSERGRSAPARLIVATEDGTIAGFSQDVDRATAIIEVVQMYRDDQNAVFKGLAIAQDMLGREFLFATDFRGGVIDVYDNTWRLVDSFTGPDLPRGFAPFGIHTINNQLWVTYAVQGPGGMDDVAGPGNGFVDVFNVDGTFVRRFTSDGPLNSPWGVTIAPRQFDASGNTVLIGNFGDGRINAFSMLTGAFLGQLRQANGQPVVIDGLWSIESFRNTTLPFVPPFGPPSVTTTVGTRDIFFTAGINDEADGLFGRIRRVQ